MTTLYDLTLGSGYNEDTLKLLPTWCWSSF